MEPVRLNPECIRCLLKKQITCYPEDARQPQVTEYMQRVLRVIADAPLSAGAPEIVDAIYDIQKRMFGYSRDYSSIKTYFNQLMLRLEPDIRKAVGQSQEPLRAAIQYAMVGNYIDFGAMEQVDEDRLRELLAGAKDIPVDDTVWTALKADLGKAGRLVYLTDNCGEIVLDKIFISQIREVYPQLTMQAVVRGGPVLNDATMEDAEQTGLTEVASVIGSGSAIAGICPDRISAEAAAAIEAAGVILSKGQGNFETLQQCGRNIYYIFMCKCRMFAERFQVPLYQGMLVNDRTLCKQDCI